jgi:hypothetical protein
VEATSLSLSLPSHPLFGKARTVHLSLLSFLLRILAEPGDTADHRASLSLLDNHKGLPFIDPPLDPQPLPSTSPWSMPT